MELCDTFRTAAGMVWREMTAGNRVGVTLNEETITELALLAIARQHQGKSIRIKVATKRAEADHGGDWAWWFVKGKAGRGFRVQAKRLFGEDLCYRSLFKAAPDPYKQLDKLVGQARTSNLLPLYCFYNSADVALPQFTGARNNCRHTYRGPSFWGCSLMWPGDVRAIGSNRLADLRPHMMPWHRLVCDANSSLVDGVAHFIDQLAALTVPGTNGKQGDGSLLPALLREQREAPGYVRYLLDEDRLGSADIGMSGEAEDFWGLSEVAEQQLAGVVVFEDRRTTFAALDSAPVEGR